MMKILLIGLGAVTGLQAQHPDISPDHIRAHVKFLSSDLLEGRGPGTRGGQLATEYIATQFDLADAKAAVVNGTFFQNLPLGGLTTESSAHLSAGTRARALNYTSLVSVGRPHQ